MVVTLTFSMSIPLTNVQAFEENYERNVMPTRKYENFDEMVQEIKDDLVKNLQISIETIEKNWGVDFIENHIGLLNGYYYC